MVRRLPAPNKEPGANPGQFADYCKKLRLLPALRARPLGCDASWEGEGTGSMLWVRRLAMVRVRLFRWERCVAGEVLLRL